MRLAGSLVIPPRADRPGGMGGLHAWCCGGRRGEGTLRRYVIARMKATGEMTVVVRGI